jgi:ATP-dependent Clp protease protease subunit
MREELEDHEIVVNKFTEESVKDFRKKVNRLASVDPSMPIVVTIDSYGGYVDSFNTMLSIMKSVPNTFITVCQGKAMSAGAALLSLGDIRFCDSDARIMIHEASGGAVGHADDIKTDAKEHERINRQIMDLIAARCGMSYEQLKAIIKENEGRDLYLTAQQAKNIGLIDFIGLPLVRPSVSYSVEVLPSKKPIVIEDKTGSMAIAKGLLNDLVKATKKPVKKKTESKKKSKKK